MYLPKMTNQFLDFPYYQLHFYWYIYIGCFLISSVQSLSHVRLLATPWMQHTRPPCPSPAPGLMSIESVMPFNHLILSHPLLLLPSIFPSIRVFSNESTQCINKKFLFFFAFPRLFVCIEFTLLKKTLSYFKYFSPYSTITSKD